MGADSCAQPGETHSDVPDYLANLAQIWRGDDAPATHQDYAHSPVPLSDGTDSPRATIDALAAGLVDLIGRMSNHDPSTPQATATAVDTAHRHGQPAWAAAARGVVACYWLQVGEEPLAIAELVRAELELADAQASPPQQPAVPSGVAAASNNLGVAHSQLGYYELAQPHLSRAAAITAATYQGEFAAQALVDIYNLAEFELRWALQLLGVDRDPEAIRRATSALTHSQQVRNLVARSHQAWQKLVELADCLAIGARSIMDIASVTAADCAQVDAIAGSDGPQGPDTVGLILAIQARVRRLRGDAAGARTAAAQVSRRAAKNDLAIICVAWREAALATAADEATATGRYAEATAVALDALRQRAVRDFRARVDMAQLRRHHADALETTARLQQALDVAAQEEARLVHAATHDALTGLPNRALLYERLTSALRRAREAGRHMAVAFVDVNGLKGVNDQYGHAAGDQLVCGVAEALRSVTGPQDTVARVGGDEFVVVVVSRGDERSCLAWVDHLREVLQTPEGPTDQAPATRASAGVCVVAPACDLPGEAILARADERMYEAKSAGWAHPSVELLA